MDLLERFNSKYQNEKITPIAEKKELADFETVSKRILPAVDKAIVELNEADREEYEEHAPIIECDGGLWSNIVLNDMLDDAAGPESLDTDTPKSPGDDNATIAAAPTIQDLQEKAFMHGYAEESAILNSKSICPARRNETIGCGPRKSKLAVLE